MPSYAVNAALSAASLACFALLIGCAEPADTSAAPPPVTAAAAQAPPTPVVPVAIESTVPAKAPSGGDLEVAPTSGEATEENLPVADYKPPFPDRKDLFTPPKRQGGVQFKNGESEQSVVLMGFVRVDEPLAVLSVNGEVISIAEGAKQYGIEVISIHPPTVVLQRGRQRWQASLEN